VEFFKKYFGEKIEKLWPSNASKLRFNMKTHYQNAIGSYWQGHTEEGNTHRKKHAKAYDELTTLQENDFGFVHEGLKMRWFFHGFKQKHALAEIAKKSESIRRLFERIDNESSKHKANQSKELIENNHNEIERLRKEITDFSRG